MAPLLPYLWISKLSRASWNVPNEHVLIQMRPNFIFVRLMPGVKLRRERTEGKFLPNFFVITVHWMTLFCSFFSIQRSVSLGWLWQTIIIKIKHLCQRQMIRRKMFWLLYGKLNMSHIVECIWVPWFFSTTKLQFRSSASVRGKGTPWKCPYKTFAYTLVLCLIRTGWCTKCHCLTGS